MSLMKFINRILSGKNESVTTETENKINVVRFGKRYSYPVELEFLSTDGTKLSIENYNGHTFNIKKLFVRNRNVDVEIDYDGDKLDIDELCMVIRSHIERGALIIWVIDLPYITGHYITSEDYITLFPYWIGYKHTPNVNNEIVFNEEKMIREILSSNGFIVARYGSPKI